jgi:hypothetical protein
MSRGGSLEFLIHFRGEADALAKSTGGREFLNALDYACLLRGLELRKHGQRENFYGDLFGDREIALFVSEAFVCFLQVQRNWIVDAGIDFRGG